MNYFLFISITISFFYAESTFYNFFLVLIALLELWNSCGHVFILLLQLFVNLSGISLVYFDSARSVSNG